MGVVVKVVEQIDGKEVTQICLRNANGIVASFLTLGATWQAFLVPTEQGKVKNLILGFERPSDYLRNSLCAGQAIGRVAGRIASGSATIEKRRYQLPINASGHCLHGGPNGFHTKHWDYDCDEGKDFSAVTFTLHSRASDDGFPGDMTTTVTYKLDDMNRLSVTFTGKEATETTLFNPTVHPYFNMSQYQDLHSHTIRIAADYILETDQDLIPTGQCLDVTGTPYDFRQEQSLSSAIAQTEGLDDAFWVNSKADEPILVLTDEDSGDQISVYSKRQGVVVYTMNSLEEGVIFSRDNGAVGRPQEGVAIEPQDLPDAVNHEHFNQVFLKPGEEKTYDMVFAYRGTQT